MVILLISKTNGGCQRSLSENDKRFLQRKRYTKERNENDFWRVVVLPNFHLYKLSSRANLFYLSVMLQSQELPASPEEPVIISCSQNSSSDSSSSSDKKSKLAVSSEESLIVNFIYRRLGNILNLNITRIFCNTLFDMML